MSRPEKIGRSEGNRIWEIDALRGVLILCVLVWHLYFTVEAFCIKGGYQIDPYWWVNTTDPLHIWFTWDADLVIRRTRWIQFLEPTILLGVDIFFVISGICCLLSKNNLKRSLVTLGAALFVAAFTKGISIWTGDPSRFIRFGALACYAFCQLAYVYLFERFRSRTLLLFVIPVFFIGYYIRYVGVPAMRLPIFYIFGVPQIGDQSSDFWPVFPMLGWFLIGVVLGRKFYHEKKSLFHFSTDNKFRRLIQKIGQYSGIIYVSHMVIYTVFFCGIGYLFKLL